MLVARTQRQKAKGKGKTSEERKKRKKREEKRGNYDTYHEPLFEDWIERDHEFSTESASNPSIQNLFIGQTPNEWIMSPLNKS